jgi:hypothetical protein
LTLLDISPGGRLDGRHGLHALVLAFAPRQRDDLVLFRQLAVAASDLLLGLVALVAGLLVAGAATEHAAQFQKDHDCQNKEQECGYIDPAVHHTTLSSQCLACLM